MTKDKETKCQNYDNGDSTVSSKRTILKKKLQVEKLALQLKIAKQQCEDEMWLIRAETLQCKKLLEINKKAKESKLEYGCHGPRRLLIK